MDTEEPLCLPDVLLDIDPKASRLIESCSHSKSQTDDDEEPSDSETIVDESPLHQLRPPLTISDPQHVQDDLSISRSHSPSPIPNTPESPPDDTKCSTEQPIVKPILSKILTSVTQIRHVTNLEEMGYTRCKNIANTLQGKTFTATHCDDPSRLFAIKYAAKDLYKKGITISKEGKAYNIQEDIVKEGHMMMQFMQHNPPNALIKTYDFFEDDDFYYLSMEYGGSDFFDFVVNCHQLINEGKLSLK